MNKIKVSHEAPLYILNEIQKFNDYDYCLPHLMDENKTYKKFFQDSKKQGRYIIMDNSLHELGKAYTESRLLHWVDRIEPNEFIIPDVWEDRDASVVNARKWSQIELPKGVEKVAVVQATTIHEATTCYQTYKDLGYKKIAFSYGASYYNDVCPHPNKDLGKALGRIYVIAALHKTGIISNTDRIHLLGCSVPQEFSWYQGYEFIESIDTSNPIMAALEGTQYSGFGLEIKPKANMNDNFLIPGNEVNRSLLLDNLKMFRKINNL
tara:strand:+ start:18 stop:812 length:795 start_codon:yes stop_codon:yes gene_type:complete